MKNMKIRFYQFSDFHILKNSSHYKLVIIEFVLIFKVGGNFELRNYYLRISPTHNILTSFSKHRQRSNQTRVQFQTAGQEIQKCEQSFKIAREVKPN